MKRYYLGYNLKGCGDVLMIMFVPGMQASHWLCRGDVCLIYNGPLLIGVNVFNFSQIVKIKCQGVILNPPPLLITILNQKFDNEGIDVYLPSFSSGFVIGRVENVAVNGIRKKASIDLAQRTVSVDVGAHVIEAGRLIAVVADHALLADGSFYEGSPRLALSGDIDNGASDPKQLLEVSENAIVGSEYFSSGAVYGT